MKKTYISPTMLAVTLQHENSILTYSIQHTGTNTGDITGPEEDDPTTGGGDVKGYTSQDLWNNEW